MPAPSSLRRHVTPLLSGLLLVLAAGALASCGGGTSTSGSSTTTTSTPVVVPKPLPGSRTTSTTTTTTTVAVGTLQLHYDPYGAGGKVIPTLTITRTVSGTCVSPGVAGTSSYRCFVHPGATVYDPCFAPPHATSGPLVCVPDPATPVGVTFDTGALPAAPPGAPAHRLWAMRISNGQVCVLVDAAWGGLGPFGCPSPGSARPQADCRTPTSGSPWWSTTCQLGKAASFAFRPFRVEVVWR